jgi:hypothetical protein
MLRVQPQTGGGSGQNYRRDNRQKDGWFAFHNARVPDPYGWVLSKPGQPFKAHRLFWIASNAPFAYRRPTSALNFPALACPIHFDLQAGLVFNGNMSASRMVRMPFIT